MNALDKLRKSRVDLQKTNPFFSYLSMHLDMKEDNTIPSCGVDFKGHLFYNSKWIEALPKEQVTGVVCHEVMHVALEHLIRCGKRIPEIFNIASDLVVNDIILGNNFELPDGCLKPEKHAVKIDKIHIKEINKKTAEEIYNELAKHTKTITVTLGKDGNKGGFDVHIFGTGTDKQLREEVEKEKRKWKKALSEATAFAKLQGNLPAGMERVIGEILYPKISWKELLMKYIVREIPCDYTFRTPSRRSIATGFYMPSVLRESIDVMVAIDTSGSIGNEEINDFMAEVVGIARAFNSIHLTVLSCDAEVNAVTEVNNSYDVSSIKIKGGGGTDFRPVGKWIAENKPQAKILVYLTDGFGSFPESETIRTIWVLSKNSIDEDKVPFGHVVKLD